MYILCTILCKESDEKTYESKKLSHIRQTRRSIECTENDLEEVEPIEIKKYLKAEQKYNKKRKKKQLVRKEF